MAAKVSINGFGRIGRNVLRAAWKSDTFEIAAINDLTDAATLCHLLKYDSVQGVFDADISATDDSILINGREIKVFQEPDPSKLPWKNLGIDIALESTGHFTQRPDAEMHLKAGAGKVVISAPGIEPDVTICMGVNNEAYRPDEHKIISNASCTTNCLTPVAKVLLENFGIVKGYMNTVHSYTNDQKIHDLPHKDLRRGRSAGLSMIPTTTGATEAATLILPQLKGKLEGMAIRVPTPNVSLIDLVVETEKDTCADEVNKALEEASKGDLQGIIHYCPLPLVSVDFKGCPASATIDALSTSVIGDRLVKVIAWYDNEVGYSNRTKELLELIAKNL